MKATGIVRKVDPLGRITLPKELRDVYGLAAGARMEVFTSNEGLVIRKYQESEETKQVIKDVQNLMSITDNQEVKTIMQNVLHLLDRENYKL